MQTVSLRNNLHEITHLDYKTDFIMIIYSFRNVMFILFSSSYTTKIAVQRSKML